MPNRVPYGTCPGVPVTCTLAAGTVLSRVHSDRFRPAQFNHSRADSPYAGGRFDSAAGDYGYLYAGDHPEVAFDEVLLRDEPTDETGVRTIPRSLLRGRSLSGVQVLSDLQLVDLSTTDGLVAVGQDQWLTECQADHYPHTRAWAQAIRSWVPLASGFRWHPRHNREGMAYVLFSDGDGLSPRPDAAAAMADGAGQSLLVGRTRRLLNPWLARRMCRLS